jgi:hypothetical protein
MEIKDSGESGNFPIRSLPNAACHGKTTQLAHDVRLIVIFSLRIV